MSFSKEQYWNDKPNNIGSKRPHSFHPFGRFKPYTPQIIRETPKQPSKYAIRKNTKRAIKFNAFQNAGE